MMNRLVLTFALLFTSALAKARPEVVLPAVAEVSNLADLKLLEIAELKDFSRATFREISQLVIWQAARSVQAQETKTEVKLSRSEISKLLRDFVLSNEELKKANVAFKIPEQVTLQFAPSVSKQAVERGLVNTLNAKCAACTYKIQLSAVPILKSTTWTIDYDQEIRNGSFLLPVQDDTLDLRSASKQWITGSVKIKQTVPVLKKALRFGERLEKEDIDLQEVDVTFLKEDAPTIKEVTGLIANRTLQARMPILRGDFKKEPAARRGQILKALVGSESFEVSINAVAEENGAIGDTIKIQNPETRKMMSAVIVEKGVVKVQ